VILYATCTLNRDFLSPWNPEVDFTPALEALGRESVVFRRHTTEAGQSGPAYASIFSGTEADRHGVFHHPTHLRDELYLVAEAFSDAGYETFFWNGHPMASIELGYGQGVSARNNLKRRPPDQAMLTGLDPRFQEILAKLAADPDYKAFVQINFTLTHGPYHEYSPARMTERFHRHFPDWCADVTRKDFERYLQLYNRHRRELQYDFPAMRASLGMTDEDVLHMARMLELVYSSCVNNLDRYVGRFVEEIRQKGALDESLIAFTADHGEILYRSTALFHWCHGGQLVPEVLDVPLLLYGAGAGLAPGTYGGVTRSIDVYPTLAGLCGIELGPERGVAGVDLSAALRGDEPPPDLVALSRTTTLAPPQAEEAREWSLYHSFHPRTDPLLMWVRARRGDTTYKLRDWGGGDWRMGVFDLASDPEETRDLFDPASAEHAAMRAYLDAYRERLVRAYAELAADRDPGDPEVEASLRAMGYIR